MVLLISYDLNNHERPSSYEAVRAVIERYASSARKPLYSQWFVETADDTQTFACAAAGAPPERAWAGLPVAPLGQRLELG